MVETEDKPKFENWLRPKEALTILKTAYPSEDTAKHLLVNRLASGAITSIAEHATWTGLASGKPHQGLSTISEELWRDYYRFETGFWDSGDLGFNLGHYKGSFNNVSVRYQGIRFDPGAIQKLAGAAENRIQTTVNALNAAPPAAKAEEPAQKGKPITGPDLALWAALYNRVYGGTATDTLDFAWKSAQGMFPDKSVARDRVRPLVGSGTRKRGPKGPAE